MSAGFDYDAFRADAVELIEDAGRDVVLTREARATDAEEPWIPSQATGTADEAQSITVKAVILGATEGYLVGRAQSGKGARILIAPTADLPEDLSVTWTIVDGADVWKNVSIEKVQPGPTIVLYKGDLRG
jgi:hypothetical protein